MKKVYMQPEMQVVEMDFEQQILAGSLTDVTTTGLDDPIAPPPSTPGDSWNEGMAPFFDFDEKFGL